MDTGRCVVVVFLKGVEEHAIFANFLVNRCLQAGQAQRMSEGKQCETADEGQCS